MVGKAEKTEKPFRIVLYVFLKGFFVPFSAKTVHYLQG